VGVFRDSQNFFGYPLLSQEQVSYELQIWLNHSQCPSEQKPIKKFWRKGSMGISRDCQIFLGTIPPIISGMGKATNFQFCMHIYRRNRNRSPLRISGKVAMGVVRDTRKFSGHPYIGRITWSALR